MNAKELIQKAKALFNAPIAPVVAPAAQEAPAVPAAPVAPAPVAYKTKDGQDIAIAQVGADIAPGDVVTVAGAPAPAGVLEIEDGRHLTVGEGGVITQVSEAAPVTQDLTTATQPAPVVPVAPVQAPAQRFEMPETEEEAQKLFEKFASGTPEERISNLEVIARALMENVLGWKIGETQRKANEEAAIATYNESLKNAELKLEKQNQVISGLFEAVEKLAETPTADPVTLTGQKKESFRDKKEAQLERFSNSLKEFKSEINK